MNSSSNALPPFAKGRPAGHRLWVPAIIGLVAVAGVALVRGRPEMEQNFREWSYLMVVMATLLLLLIWFLFLSRVKWRSRLITVGVLALAVFGLTKLLRVDGTLNGTGLPKLVWSWTPVHTVPLATPVVSTAPSGVVEGATDVPQFFGPHRDGIIKNAGLAHDWTAKAPKQLWRHPVGPGWSAFAVVGGRAFTQEQRDENETVSCYDLLTGQLIWAHTNAAHFSQWQGGDGPRATPTVEHDRVFAVGATGILDCLEVATGKLVWSRNVLAENKLENIIWGISDSPLVFDDTVVVTGGQTHNATVIAYRKLDGQALWQSGTDKASYASPMLATLAGKRVVLSFNAASFTAHDPVTGSVLLDYPFTNDKWPKASQPVVLDGDRVFLSAGYGAGCTLLQIKTSADGKLSATELWKNLHMKTQFNSVAARAGYLYGIDDGALACVEIATGDRKWKDGHFGSGQTLMVDDLLIIQAESGAVVLAQAKPEGFRELGSFPALKGKTWNYPTLAGRYLLVRNSEEMACYELPVQTADSKTAAR